MTTWPLEELKISVLTKRESDRVALYDLGEKVVTTTWPLSELKVSVLTNFGVVGAISGVGTMTGWVWQNLHLPESPLVLTLLSGDKKNFDDMATHVPTREIKVEMTDKEINNKTTYERFLDLYKDIKNNGVKNTSTIRINENHMIEDGHHRLAILYSLGEKEITLPDSQTVKK